MAKLLHITHCGLPGIDRVPVGMHDCRFYSSRNKLAAAVSAVLISSRVS
jgi:hypothetical protein